MGCVQHIRSIFCHIGSLQIKDGVHILAHHLCYQLYFCDITDIIAADQMSVTKDRKPVADGKYLIKEMRNKDDAHALCFQLTHNIEEQLHFVVIQGRGRLIQDQDLGLYVNRARDSNHLLHGSGIIGKRTAHINILMEPGHQFLCPACYGPPVDLAVTHRLPPDKDILRHSQVRAEVDLLVHRGNTQFHGVLGALGMNGLPIHDNGSRIHVVNPCEAFDQRGFTGAVLAKQGMNFTRTQ